ncbi:DUF6124 family protein [Pseudomonas syringae]|nr:DUF6124 family protein [Pseudomonas syringae]
MVKITPDPPPQHALHPDRISDEAAAQLAQEHWGANSPDSHKPIIDVPQSLFTASPDLSAEEALTTACELLQSVIATSYETAENLNGSRRKLALAAVHLAEMAHTLVDSVLEKKCSV